ncbi:MAG: DUF1634 domain-containing protein [Candidatus Njordarchaeales archaeon]
MKSDKLLSQKVFQTGLLISLSLIFMGLVSCLVNNNYSLGNRERLITVFRNFSVTNPFHIIYLGITVLAVTPIITLLILSVYYAIERDKVALSAFTSFFVIITLFIIRLFFG